MAARKKATPTTKKGRRRKAVAGRAGAFLLRIIKSRRTWKALGATTVTLAFVAAVMLAYYAADLPDLEAVLAQEQTPLITVLAADGSQIATYGGGRGEWLGRADIPDVVVDAVLAIEDRRFFDHGGFDYWGILRALISNIMAGEFIQGGSTITQQLAKNMFLTPDRTLKRKVQEAMVAYWLEGRLSKDDILEQYLNRVYLGAGAYGLEAASRRYFGISGRDLDVTQAALIAGLLKAPSRFSPLRDKATSDARTAIVLDAMVDAAKLSPERRSTLSPPVLAARPLGGSERYFTDWVVSELHAYIGDHAQDVRVETTFDARAQKAAQEALSAALDEWGAAREVAQGAVVVMDTDGAVQAMVGGRSYRQSEFNRAVNALRQPGSAFKLFVYLTGFEAGMSPEDRMRDSPFILEGWRPQNYGGGFKGTMTLRQAFAESVNTIAVKLAERANRTNVIKATARLGITTPVVRQPSLALGTSEVRLIDLTGAYATIANRGYAVRPHGIVRVTAPSGAVLYERRASPTRVVSPRVVAQLNDIMRETVRNGTGRAAGLANRTAAGKTGTSQDSRDAWFIGYAGRTVAGVWVGNDDFSPMKRVTGGFIPARVWKQIMLKLDG